MTAIFIRQREHCRNTKDINPITFKSTIDIFEYNSLTSFHIFPYKVKTSLNIKILQHK